MQVHVIAALGTCYYHTEQETCAYFDKKVYVIERNCTYDTQVGGKPKDRFFKADFPPNFAVLSKSPIWDKYRESVHKKSLWQLRVSIHECLCVQTNLGSIILSLCLYCTKL